MQDVESVVKAPFRPGGALRNKPIANCEFRNFSHVPLYRADWLLDDQIFTSIVELVFTFEYDA